MKCLSVYDYWRAFHVGLGHRVKKRWGRKGGLGDLMIRDGQLNGEEKQQKNEIEWWIVIHRLWGMDPRGNSDYWNRIT